MEKALVSFALIGDPQYADREPCGERNYQYGHALHRETIHKLNRVEELDFIVSLGDLGDGFSREERAAFAGYLGRAYRNLKTERGEEP